MSSTRPPTHARSRAAVRLAALVLAVPALALLPAGPPVAVAAGGCDLYASPSGNDANDGSSPAAAVRSPIVLLGKLSAGQTGCLKDGATFVLGAGAGITATGGVEGAPKTLRPTTPGARARITTATGLWLQAGSHDITLQDLDIRRTGASGGSLFLVDGDRIVLDGLDLTYPANICLDVGEDPRTAGADSADDFWLIDSRVHDCGSSYGPPRTPNDSGVHGVYLQYTRDGGDPGEWSAVLYDNVIDHNHNRGVQLYPDVDDALIYHNVLFENGANLNLGSQSSTGNFSERNTVQDNVIAESTLDGLDAGGFVGDTAEVVGNFPPGTSTGNVVNSNCVVNSAHPDHLFEGFGYTRLDNAENLSPVFVDAAGGDYRQAPGSPCAADGLVVTSVPEAPTLISSTPSTGAVTLVFSGNGDGGSEITGYRAECTSPNGGVTGTATAAITPIEVTGLTAGAAYRCRVQAVNSVGPGPFSPPGQLVFLPPATKPAKPKVTAARAAPGAATVSFVSTGDGGSPILGVTAECTSSDGGVKGSVSGTGSPLTVTGLTAGASYRCHVKARNVVGTSAFGALGTVVVVPAPVVPLKPQVTGTLPAPGAATVSFAPTGDGGSPITGYTVQCGGSSVTAVTRTTPTSPVVVDGLTVGGSYHCRVRATNAVGTGAYGDYGVTFTVPAP